MKKKNTLKNKYKKKKLKNFIFFFYIYSNNKFFFKIFYFSNKKFKFFILLFLNNYFLFFLKYIYHINILLSLILINTKFMFLKKKKNIANSVRWENKLFYYNKIIDKTKIFFLKNKNYAGRSSKSGKILIFSKSKQKFNINYFLKNKINFLINNSIIIKLRHNNKTKKCFLKTYFGYIFLSSLSFGNFLLDFITFFFFKIKKLFFNIGNNSFLNNIKNFFFINNITINLKNKKKIASSCGTFCQIIKTNLDLNYFIVILPSKKKKKIYKFALCTIGRCSDMMWKYSILGNYKNNYNFNKKQSVRGVAMNPVDHPHGGRTKTNCPEVSPWGWITKNSH